MRHRDVFNYFWSFGLTLLLVHASAAGLGKNSPPKGSNLLVESIPSLYERRGLLTRSAQFDIFFARESSTTQQLKQTQFQTELNRVDALVHAKDLEGLIKAADDIEKRWGKAGGQHYGRLMLNMSDAIENNFREQKVFSLSQKYATEALAKAETFSLTVEAELLGFLTRHIALRATAGNREAEWTRERRTKTKLWLHAWQRLEKGIDRSFSFNDRPALNVMPPEETGLPAGVGPDAIKDPRLRAKFAAAIAANAKRGREYSRQFELRYLDGIFPKHAEQYLVRVYSTPPYNLRELTRYLNIYITDKNVRERILNQINKNMLEAQTAP